LPSLVWSPFPPGVGAGVGVGVTATSSLETEVSTVDTSVFSAAEDDVSSALLDDEDTSVDDGVVLELSSVLLDVEDASVAASAAAFAWAASKAFWAFAF